MRKSVTWRPGRNCKKRTGSGAPRRTKFSFPGDGLRVKSPYERYSTAAGRRTDPARVYPRSLEPADSGTESPVYAGRATAGHAGWRQSPEPTGGYDEDHAEDDDPQYGFQFSFDDLLPVDRSLHGRLERQLIKLRQYLFAFQSAAGDGGAFLFLDGCAPPGLRAVAAASARLPALDTLTVRLAHKSRASSLHRIFR